MRLLSTVIDLRQTAKIKKFQAPPRPKGIQYKHLRPREDLTYDEVMRLVKAAEHVGRNRLRDGTMIIMAYVHAMRASELCGLKWNQIDLSGRSPSIKVLRVKGSKDSDHPLEGEEVRRLRKVDVLCRDSQYVFVTETGGPLPCKASGRLSCARVRSRACLSPSTPTCCATPAGSKCSAMACTCGLFRSGWATWT